jgi:hypothetical protein
MSNFHMNPPFTLAGKVADVRRCGRGGVAIFLFCPLYSEGGWWVQQEMASFRIRTSRRSPPPLPLLADADKPTAAQPHRALEGETGVRTINAWARSPPLRRRGGHDVTVTVTVTATATTPRRRVQQPGALLDAGC